MTPEQMRRHCLEQIEICGPDADVGFVLPRIWRGQKKMKLANVPGAPVGEPVGHVKGGTMCFFSAREVLEWLGKLEKKQFRL